jgi:hypothetical protein
MSFWRKIFGKQNFANQATTACASRSATATPSSSPPPVRGAPAKACLTCQRKFSALLVICPTCGSAETMTADGPEWFEILQAHVTAVQCNDRAVQWFREGRLDEAIAELRCGLEASPQYATGYSNLGFLYLWKGKLDQAVECVLRALEADPHHKDAPDHLFDVLRALTDELVQIGCTEGFLSTQPGGAFDDHNRHRRTREIGALIATIGQRGVFKVDGRAVEKDLFMAHVINDVQKKMGHHSNSTALKFAWDGLGGWHPCVAVPLPHHMELRHGV